MPPRHQFVKSTFLASLPQLIRPDWARPGWVGPREKKWFDFDVWDFRGIAGGANLSELLSNGIILIWSLSLWDTIHWHAQPILSLWSVETYVLNLTSVFSSL